MVLLGQMFLGLDAWACKDHGLLAGALSRHLYVRLNCHTVPGVWKVFRSCISLSLGDSLLTEGSSGGSSL